MKLDLNFIDVDQINKWFESNPPKEVMKSVVTTLQRNGFMLSEIQGIMQVMPKEGTQPKMPTMPKKSDNPTHNGTDMTEIINILTQLISASAGVDEKQVNKLIKTYLSTAKIGLGMLDDTLRKMLTKEPQKFEVILPPNWKKSEDDNAPDFPQPITDIIISDLNSRLPNKPKGGGNNVYLFGGAGTGKTYIFKAIAEFILNVEIVTVNCNQFTSPTELIGGQTIEGYQQGELIKAYASIDVPEGKNGFMVLLDELPKLDPNTAGVLNDLLSSARDGGSISDGRLKKWKRGDKEFFIVATGNTKLNQADPEYEANQRQDMSLVDRFSGSMYKFVIDLNNERDFYASYGCLFIWNYLCELRFFLQEKNYTNFGFVSRRLINSIVATTLYEFAAREQGKSDSVKTPQIGMETFLDLFDPDQITQIRKTHHTTNFWMHAQTLQYRCRNMPEITHQKLLCPMN